MDRFLLLEENTWPSSVLVYGFNNEGTPVASPERVNWFQGSEDK
jgi:hypothetical protein